MPKITDNNEVKRQAYRGGEEALVLTPDNKLARVPFDTLRRDVLNYQTRNDLSGAGAPSNGEMVRVWNDPVFENNGFYGWNGTQWSKSLYSPEDWSTGKNILFDPINQYVTESTDMNDFDHFSDYQISVTDNPIVAVGKAITSVTNFGPPLSTVKRDFLLPLSVVGKRLNINVIATSETNCVLRVVYRDSDRNILEQKTEDYGAVFNTDMRIQFTVPTGAAIATIAVEPDPGGNATVSFWGAAVDGWSQVEEHPAWLDVISSKLIESKDDITKPRKKRIFDPVNQFAALGNFGDYSLINYGEIIEIEGIENPVAVNSQDGVSIFAVERLFPIALSGFESGQQIKIRISGYTSDGGDVRVYSRHTDVSLNSTLASETVESGDFSITKIITVPLDEGYITAGIIGAVGETLHIYSVFDSDIDDEPVPYEPELTAERLRTIIQTIAPKENVLQDAGVSDLQFSRALRSSLARGRQLMIASENLHPPTFFGVAVGAGYEISTSSVRTVTPDYKVNRLVLAWSNWATDNDGSQLPEIDGDAVMTVEAAIVIDGVRFADITFSGGSLSADIQPGESVFCDPISVPALINKEIEILTTRTVSVGDSHIGGYGVKYADYYSKYTNGVYYSSDSTEHDAIRNGGAMTTNASSQYGYFYGPSLMLTDGNDGRDVALLLGDSVGYGEHHFAHSFLTKPLVDYKVPYLSLCVPGTRPTNTDSRSPGEFRRRAELMDGCRTENGGLPVFDFIISEQGGNNSIGDDAQLLIDKLIEYWTFIRFEFQCPVYQTTYIPRMNGDPTYFGTDQATNISESLTDTEYTDRWGAGDYIKLLPDLIDGCIDIRPGYTEDSETSWPVFDFNGKITVAESSTNAKTIYMDAEPPVGSVLIFRPGTVDAEYHDGWVTQVQAHANGFEVELNYKLGTELNIDDDVKVTYSRDGVHLAGPYANEVGAEVVKQFLIDKKVING